MLLECAPPWPPDKGGDALSWGGGGIASFFQRLHIFGFHFKLSQIGVAVASPYF